MYNNLHAAFEAMVRPAEGLMYVCTNEAESRNFSYSPYWDTNTKTVQHGMAIYLALENIKKK
jgi:hypothetical protein